MKGKRMADNKSMINPMKDENKWIKWAAEIQAIAQNGLTFAEGVFDRQRYESLLQIAADIMTTHSSQALPSVIDLFDKQAGYATPKIDVRGAVFKDKTVLLVKERSDQKWTLPGGWADVNYSPAFCVEKEILEESGFTARAFKLIALFDKLKHEHPPQWPHAHKCFFLCELLGGAPQTSIETSDVGFFALDSLPPLSLHRVTQSQIERCYQHYLDPALATDFD
jgi:ADP-ribose pyrophosphatase YjhB (NUDIX family)